MKGREKRIEKITHLILVAHSGKWSDNLSTDFRENVNKLISECETSIQGQYSEISLKPVFIPYEGESTSNQDEVLKIINECSYAIIDVTDYDEELAFVLGSVAISQIQNINIISGASKKSIDSYAKNKPVKYNLVTDLLEIICKDIEKLLADQPVPERLIYDLWFPRDVKSIWVVCPQIEEPGEFARRGSLDYTYLDNLGDTDSLLEVMVFLSKYYPLATIEKFSSRDLPIGLTNGNLVVIGGPGTPESINNHLAKSMMEAVNSRIRYSKDCDCMLLKTGDKETEFTAKSVNDEEETGDDRFNLFMDYGYYSRFKNPANKNNHVICINGIHTSGVLGAVCAFSNNPEALYNYQVVLKNLKGIFEFESFFEVNLLNGKVLIPQIKSENVLKFNEKIKGYTSKHQDDIIEESDSKPKVFESSITTVTPAEKSPSSSVILPEPEINKLRLVRVLSRQIVQTKGKIFEKCSGIFLLHMLPDLPPFLKAFETLGLDPSKSIIYYKRYPYNNKNQTIAVLQKLGYQLEEMENREKTLPKFLERIGNKQKVFILEDGGYIGPLLHKLDNTPWSQISGAVEQTERGVRMYEKLPTLKIPVAPVARSGLKDRQEPPHIGRTIIDNIGRLLKGTNLSGNRCLVIGYGRIGESVCASARDHGMVVSVYDSDRGALAKAAQTGYNTHSDLRTLLSDAQIVIGTTGNESLGKEHILSLKHGAVLVSGSSGQYEIGIEALEILSSKQVVKDIGTEYTLEKEDRALLLLGDGYPINFVAADSIADEAIDPVLAALFITSVSMILEPPANGVQLDWTNTVISKYELENLFFELYFSK